jgi:hypothetical protein
MAVSGQCRLCLRNNVVLRDSHFLSKGIYKILRDPTAKIPDPFHITPSTSLQTSKQLKHHLLCETCECRLNGNGETWVLGKCLHRDGTFPLAHMLSRTNPDLAAAGNPTKLYYANRIPSISVSSLAYFGASIFWRGSIHPWNEDGSFPVILGPFQERFRRYLVGEESFPTDACLWVAVREGKGLDRLTHVPTLVRVDGLHAYKFPMPGLAFTLIVSKNIPARLRTLCIVHGPASPIVVTSILEDWLAQDAVRLLRTNNEPLHGSRA